MKISAIKRQSGYVLLTGLIFILMITLITTSTMQSTNIDYKIASNSTFKDVAFQNSETGRLIAGDNLSNFIFELEGISLTGLTYASDYNPDSDEKEDSEDLLDSSTLNVDMTYNVTKTGVEPIRAEMAVIRGDGINSNNSGFQQLSGYEGTGKSAASGGIQLVYELRSTGYGGGEAVAVTATEYRIIP